MSVAKTSCRFETLPSDALDITLGFLDARDLCRAERVCVSWHKQINSADQYLWFQLCATLHIPTIGKEIEKSLSSDESEKSFDLRTISIISSYAEDLKDRATIIHGKIALACSQFCVNKPMKDGSPRAELRWGMSSPELFVAVKVYSEESQKECLQKHPKAPSSFSCMGTHPFVQSLAGSWHDHYSRIPNGKFPTWLPLRLFINKDGDFLKQGDKLYLLYQKQPVILQCMHDQEFVIGAPIFCNASDFNTWEVDIASSSTAAVGEIRQWISSD